MRLVFGAGNAGDERLFTAGCDRILLAPLYPQYSSATNGTVVDAAKGFVDDAADSATELQREQMIDAFVVASRYELMFWDSALHPTPWPSTESAVHA